MKKTTSKKANTVQPRKQVSVGYQSLLAQPVAGTGYESVTSPRVQYAVPNYQYPSASDNSIPVTSPMSSGFIRNNLPFGIQAKLKIGQPNDQYEQEAERVAEQVMNMSEPRQPSQRDDSTLVGNISQRGDGVQCQEDLAEEEELIQTKSTAGFAPKIVPSINNGILSIQGGGQLLPIQMREFFEPRFGANFSKIRIHNNTGAVKIAQSINARAFTYGHNIVFGAGEYSPETPQGKKLLAHELTHVIQQQAIGKSHVQRTPGEPEGVASWWEAPTSIDTDNPEVQKYLKGLSRKELLKLLNWVRDPLDRFYIQQLAEPEKVERISTGSVELLKTTIDNFAQGSVWQSYWGLKVWETYDIERYSDVDDRFNKNNYERDEVLAALWQERPSGIANEITKPISVTVSPNINTGPRQPVTVHYRLVFKPAVAKAKPKVNIEFEREVSVGQQRRVIPGTDYKSFKKVQYQPDTDVNFPGSGASSYWKKHKQERKKLFYWIHKVMPGDINEQEVVVDGVAYKVTALKNKRGGLIRLDVEWLGKNFRKHLDPQIGTEQRDSVDFQLEKLQDPSTNGGPLGDVILEGVPEAEAFSVKYAIWQNYGSSLRNREIDTIIPIAMTNRRVFYTLRFRPNNDVDVERLGEEGREILNKTLILSIANENHYYLCAKKTNCTFVS